MLHSAAGTEEGGEPPEIWSRSRAVTMSCVAVNTLHLSVEQREPVHRVVAGRAPPNLYND